MNFKSLALATLATIGTLTAPAMAGRKTKNIYPHKSGDFHTYCSRSNNWTTYNYTLFNFSDYKVVVYIDGEREVIKKNHHIALQFKCSGYTRTKEYMPKIRVDKYANDGTYTAQYYVLAVDDYKRFFIKYNSNDRVVLTGLPR